MNQLEKIINKKIQDISYNEFIKHYENQDFLKYITEHAREASEYIMKNTNDEKIKNDVLPVYIEALLKESQSKIGAIFKQNKTKEKLTSEIKKFEENNNSWEALLSLYLLISSEKLEYSLPDEKRMKELINAELDDLEKLSKHASNLLFDGLDLLYILQQSYFEVTGIDLMKGNERVRNITKQLDTELKELFDSFQEDAEEKYPGIKPSDIGYIDITKLKDGE